MGVARRAARPACPASPSGGGVTPEGVEALAAVGAVAVPVSEGRGRWRRRWRRGGARGALRRAGRAAWSPRCPSERDPLADEGMPTADEATTPAKPPDAGGARHEEAAKRARKTADPAKAWASYLRRYRPGLQGLRARGPHGHVRAQVWESRLDPTSELILTILTQNTADVNAEKAYEALRVAYPSDQAPEEHKHGIGWGGEGLSVAPPPDWTAVENAPLPQLDRRHPARRARAPEGAAPPGDAPPHPRAARRLQPRVPRRHARARGARLADRHRRHRQEDRVHRARVLLRHAGHGGGPPRGAGEQAHRADPGEGDGGPGARPVPGHPGAGPDVRGPRPADPPRPGDLPRAEPAEHDLCPLRDRCRAVNPKAP